MSKHDDDPRPKGTAQKLLATARQQGTLSAASAAALDVLDLGAQIQAGLGIAVDDVAASEVVLVTMMPDDSQSIAAAGNTAAVRDGHNAVLEALRKSRQAGDVFVHTRYLNGEVLYPYVGLSDAVAMDDHNYHPRHATPLYDQTVVLLGTVIAKATELAAAGVPVRTVTLLITDGADYGSQRATAKEVRALVADMVAQENHVVAAMGIRDGTTDFQAVFRAMGIADRWILTPGNTAGEIRRAFQVFSQSAAAMTSGAWAGGFGN
ncbi:MAG: hypothetical protein KBG48_08205 [Kofleriaceae bacterium]|jgi:hypothetical protein|nr:hypothetical protein [Kofleriaceae bacterium]MBP9167354.1 hypothetical protein [Kofleriaceae bacterium]MBP9860771.1 hypothetical protein [Kofleriaceae bacterium]